MNDESEALVKRFESATARPRSDPELFAHAFEVFGAAYHVAQQQAERQARLDAPRFNIFRLLGVEHVEVKTHSAFLAELLNPYGSHGQKYLFLQSFLELCSKKCADFPVHAKPLESRQWSVETEKHTLDGNLDIVLRNPEFGFLCVIENKVFAEEQEDQVQRYATWLKRRPKSYTAKALIYLTPRGNEAKSAGESIYHRLSYRTSIAEWLRAVHNDIAAARVRNIVDQYIEVIKRL